MTELLTRVSSYRTVIDENDPIENSIRDLGRRAEQELHYFYLAKSSSRKKDMVLDILRANDILPFEQHSVDKYKSEMTRNKSLIPINNNDLVMGLLTIGGAATIAAAILSLIMFLVGQPSIATLLAVFFIIGVVVQAVAVFPNMRSRPEWSWDSLAYYNNPVPEFVLETALKTKDALSEKGYRCDFRIEELTLKKQVYDPFLVVDVADKCGEHLGSFYLEVWNEPKFLKHTVRE